MSNFIKFSTVEGNNYPNIGKYLIQQNILMLFEYIILKLYLPKCGIANYCFVMSMFKSEL